MPSDDNWSTGAFFGSPDKREDVGNNNNNNNSSPNNNNRPPTEVTVRAATQDPAINPPDNNNIQNPPAHRERFRLSLPWRQRPSSRRSHARGANNNNSDRDVAQVGTQRNEGQDVEMTETSEQQRHHRRNRPHQFHATTELVNDNNIWIHDGNAPSPARNLPSPARENATPPPSNNQIKWDGGSMESYRSRRRSQQKQRQDSDGEEFDGLEHVTAVMLNLQEEDEDDDVSDDEEENGRDEDEVDDAAPSSSTEQEQEVSFDNVMDEEEDEDEKDDAADNKVADVSFVNVADFGVSSDTPTRRLHFSTPIRSEERRAEQEVDEEGGVEGVVDEETTDEAIAEKREEEKVEVVVEGGEDHSFAVDDNKEEEEEEEVVVLVEEVNDESEEESETSNDNSRVICDWCEKLMIFEPQAVLSRNSDYCICQECNILALELSQSEVASSMASSRKSNNIRPPSFKSLRGDKYPFRILEKKGYRCKKKYGSSSAWTKTYGLAPNARLALVCLMLAKDSTFDNGKITWKAASEEALMCLEQFINDIRHDYEKLRYIPNVPATHKSQRDLHPDPGVDVVVHALRIAAEDIQDPTTSIDLWKPRKRIVKVIAKKLTGLADRIAAGDELSSMEFPWIDDGTSSKSYTFPTKEVFERNSKKLKEKLGNDNTKHTRLNIVVGLESVAASFACQKVTGSSHNDYGPPSQITKTKKRDPRQLMAEYSLESLLHGLVIGPICEGKDFHTYIPPEYSADPFKMPVEVQKDVILTFLHDVGVIPSWYIPFCLRDWDDEDKLDVNARSVEVEEMKGVFQKRIGTKVNIERLKAELENKRAMEEHKKALSDEHIRRCKEDGKELLRLCDKHQTGGPADVTLDQFKDEFTNALKQISGLGELSADDFPSLKSANESAWSNKMNDSQRRNLLSKLILEVIYALYPTEIDGQDLGRKPGDCSNANCSRNFFDMLGSAWQGAHVDRDKKKDDPSLLALGGSAAVITEMERSGIVPTCALHHDGKEGERTHELDDSKHHLLSPPQDSLKCDEGKDFLDILQNNRVRRLQYCLFIMDCYGRGMMTRGEGADQEIGSYDTLRVMHLAYFDIVADDVVGASPTQWNNNGSTPDREIRKSLRYVIQNHCGVCPGANEAGTLEAKKKPRDSWDESDRACCKENYDFRRYAFVERQRIEADHIKARATTDDSRLVSDIKNIFSMLDEICRAPYKCYFCHKRRTANQDPHSTNCDYHN